VTRQIYWDGDGVGGMSSEPVEKQVQKTINEILKTLEKVLTQAATKSRS